MALERHKQQRPLDCKHGNTTGSKETIHSDTIGSLSYVEHSAVREKWKPATRLNKHVGGAKKSAAARYLQLKSGHAITGT
jgi:hypothetical protein